MKNSLLLLSALLLASATQAQITLTSSSYPVSVIGTDSLKVTTAASSFPSLTAAANGSWDLTTVTDSTPVLYAYRVSPDTTGATFADSNFYSLSTYIYQGNVQAAITSSAYVEYGVDIDSATFSITGGSIFVPIQHSGFTAPHTVINFPATMGSNWGSTYESDFNYELTYAPVYTNAPASVKSFITETDTVVGWGHMLVKDLAGGSSAWFQVLQVKKITSVTDSFLLNGSAAPGALLTSLGVTQGQVTNTYEQNYYRPNEVTAFANVQYTDSTFTTPAQAKTHTQRLTSTGVTNIANSQGVRVYPNPVTGSVVSIDVPATGGDWAYELIDINGRKVATGALAVNGTQAQLSVPATATAGIYFIKLSNNGKQVCIKSVDIVK